MSRSKHRPTMGTYAAVALIAAGLTGAIVDNNGKVGLALFLAGAAGLVFLVGRQLSGRLAPRLHRRQVATRDAVPSFMGIRAIAVAVVSMGALLAATNVFKATDDDSLSRALNYSAWYGALALATSLVAVGVARISRWVSPTR
jgi:hypothetical protein